MAVLEWIAIAHVVVFMVLLGSVAIVGVLCFPYIFIVGDSWVGKRDKVLLALFTVLFWCWLGFFVYGVSLLER